MQFILPLHADDDRSAGLPMVTAARLKRVWIRWLPLIVLVVMLGFPADGRASSPTGNAETLLMFVGEDLEVLTIATRHEQSAGQAPAVAQVITRRQIQDHGLQTLGQALSMIPGFHMAQKEWGTMPYMRGIPNSILFLYDSVPIGSTVTKSLGLLDHEISLTRVKRIEIIRGPGTVLWGPDAYAAIVNIVPLSAADLNGSEAGIAYGTPGDQKEAYANIGYDTGRWNGMLSLNGRKAAEDDTVGNLIRFWGDGQTPEPPESRLGYQVPDDSTYFEALANLNFEDWLNVSGRISEYDKSYAMTGDDGRYTWLETQKVSTGQVKVEGSRKIDLTRGIRFQASYQWLGPDHTIIDRTVSYREDTWYGELIFDQSFLSGKGLFTGGLSFRESSATDAPTWDGYLYDFLGPDNEFLLPTLIQQDYDSRLRSVFGQYTHKFNQIDLLASVRYDDHDQYEDTVSYNLGMVWTFSPDWTLKILYGTAYRTPYPSQLADPGTPSPEKIRNLSAQVAWKPSPMLEVALTGYKSRIDDHVMEDPYAGLSEPNEQEITGIEAEIRFLPTSNLKLSANFSALDNSGPDESYYYNDYSYIDEDGNLVKHFVELKYPYDTGPKQTVNLMAQWQPFSKTTLFSRLQYIAERQLLHPLVEEDSTSPEVWLLDLNFLQRDFLRTGLDLGISVRNLLDETYYTPGTYANIQGDPFTMLVSLTVHF